MDLFVMKTGLVISQYAGEFFETIVSALYD